MAESSEPGKKITGEAKQEIVPSSEDVQLPPSDGTRIIVEELGDTYHFSQAALGGLNFGPVESRQHIEANKIEHATIIHLHKHEAPATSPGTSHTGLTEDEQRSTKRTDIPEGCAKISEDTYMFVNKPIKKGSNVYEGFIAQVRERKKPVAIKKITPSDEESEREAEHLLNLNPHQNVVEIFQSKVLQGLTHKELYIVMELCKERNLQDYLDENRKERKPLFLKEAVSFTKQLIEALKHIHGNNIIHGDLKPQNILFSLDGKQILKVSDFGISKQLKDFKSNTKLIGFGTDGYRAPETYSGDIISKGADIYSFGIIVFALFANGRHPYGDDLHECIVRMKKGKCPDLSSLSEPVRMVLSDFLMKIFQVEPKNRPTIEEIASSPPDLDSLAQIVQDPYEAAEVASAESDAPVYSIDRSVFPEEDESTISEMQKKLSSPCSQALEWHISYRRPSSKLSTDIGIEEVESEFRVFTDPVDKPDLPAVKVVMNGCEKSIEDLTNFRLQLIDSSLWPGIVFWFDKASSQLFALNLCPENDGWKFRDESSSCNDFSKLPSKTCVPVFSMREFIKNHDSVTSCHHSNVEFKTADTVEFKISLRAAVHEESNLG